MDALKLLKQDHDEVKKMLSDLESTTERAEKTRTDGLATLKSELEVKKADELWLKVDRGGVRMAFAVKAP